MKLQDYLLADKCPHCKIDKPNLKKVNGFTTQASDQTQGRIWFIYRCERCGGVVSAYSWQSGGDVVKFYPGLDMLDEALPKKAKAYLEQAINSIHAPSGAIMLCASAVDDMLKMKDYKTGSLYSRLNQAVKDNLITKDMAKWAHEVRLDANDERHADDSVDLPTTSDAEKAVDFTKAFGEYLYVLPSKIERGIKSANDKNEDEDN